MKKSASKSKVVPLCDRVIVTPPPEKAGGKPTEQMVDGIIIPESAQTGRVLAPYYIATVVAIGEDCKRVKPGETVIVDRPHLFHVEAGDTDQMMIREANIVAVLR